MLGITWEKTLLVFYEYMEKMLKIPSQIFIEDAILKKIEINQVVEFCRFDFIMVNK